MRMRGRLWGPVVHVPSAAAPRGHSLQVPDLKGRPARHQVGPSSVAVLLVAALDSVRPIVAAPMAYPAPVVVGCRQCCSAWSSMHTLRSTFPDTPHIL